MCGGFYLTVCSLTPTNLDSGGRRFAYHVGHSFDRGYHAYTLGWRDSHSRPARGSLVSRQGGTHGEPCFDFCSPTYFVYDSSGYGGDRGRCCPANQHHDEGATTHTVGRCRPAGPLGGDRGGYCPASRHHGEGAITHTSG
jgi:hypothetical protein